MRKLTRYNIIYGGDPTGVADLVNEKIAEGWEPIGGVAVRADGMMV